MSKDADLNKKTEFIPIDVPREITDGFIEDTLSVSQQLVHEDKNRRIWRCLEKEVVVPSIGKVGLRVDYCQFDGHGDPPVLFDQMRFDFINTSAEPKDSNPLIAEMHWYKEKGTVQHQYAFDLMLVHRYVQPEYRNSKGVGTSLYIQAESWAQNLADAQGKEMTLALSTDQPLTMKWAIQQGYEPYPEQGDKYNEFVQHPDEFEQIEETDSKGQKRNPALRRNGQEYRIMFRKILIAR